MFAGSDESSNARFSRTKWSMILLEENFVGHREAGNDLRESLERLLDLRWSCYRKALKQCRKKFSKKSVHELRVEIRRMQSTLALLEAVLPHDLILPLECELRNRIKALSRLRDTQVQMDTVAEMLDESPELESFHKWLKHRECRLAKRLERTLAEARMGQMTRRVSRLIRALRDLAENRHRRRNLDAMLTRATSHAFKSVAVYHRHLAPENVAAIHEMRVAFKRFRYMAEGLAKVLPGISERQLRAMQAYQSSMGEIQDVDVLIKRTEKLAKRGKLGEDFFQRFRKKLLLRRAGLVKRFLASAHRLFKFWPLGAQRESNGKTIHGIVYSPARHRG